MSTLPSLNIANKLVALQGHVLANPSLVPANLVAVVSWHTIGELYHVSQSVVPGVSCY